MNRFEPIEKKEVQRSWWYTTIRCINHYAYWRWWSLWLLFLLAVALYLLFCLDCFLARPMKNGLQAQLAHLDSVLAYDCHCDTTVIKAPDTIAGNVPYATIAPTNTSPCNQLVKSGRQGTDITEISLGTQAGNVVINYNMDDIPDQIDVYYGGKLVQSTNQLVSHQGSLIWAYSADPNIGYSCTVIIRAPANGTVWSYSVSCPQ